MGYKVLIIGLMSVAALSATSQASATLVPVTITGTSENINDTTGVFGIAGEDITDQIFAETFIIDTNVGTFAPPTATSASYNSIFGAPGPYAVSASLSINGHTFSTQGNNYSSVFITPGSGTLQSDYQIQSNDLVAGLPYSQFNKSFSLELDGSNLPSSIAQRFDLTGTGSAATSPYVLQTNGGPVTVYDSFIDGLQDANGDTIVNAQGTLYPTTIEFGAVSAAPEPSTWLLMIAGIGGIGLGFRRAKLKQGLTFAKALSA